MGRDWLGADWIGLLDLTRSMFIGTDSIGAEQIGKAGHGSDWFMQQYAALLTALQWKPSERSVSGRDGMTPDRNCMALKSMERIGLLHWKCSARIGRDWIGLAERLGGELRGPARTGTERNGSERIGLLDRQRLALT